MYIKRGNFFSSIDIYLDKIHHAQSLRKQTTKQQKTKRENTLKNKMERDKKGEQSLKSAITTIYALQSIAGYQRQSPLRASVPGRI